MGVQDESPLARLASRKGADGQPFLAAHEVAAGERLRAEFTRGGLLPSITQRWDATTRSGGGGAGPADLSDAALDCRRRVERAVAAVGPELSGVLLDVCCFLKGTERVEAERQWPARSAKLMLKTGLAALARHYGYVHEGASGRSAIRSWHGG
jgi:hypothetical protein